MSANPTQLNPKPPQKTQKKATYRKASISRRPNAFTSDEEVTGPKKGKLSSRSRVKVHVLSKSQQLFKSVPRGDSKTFIRNMIRANKVSCTVAKGCHARLQIPGDLERYFIQARTMPGRDNFEHAVISKPGPPHELTQINKVKAIKFEQLSRVLKKRDAALHVFAYDPDNDENHYCGALNEKGTDTIVIRENGFGHFDRYLERQESPGEYTAPEVAYKSLDDDHATDEDLLSSDNDVPLSQESNEILLAKTKRYSLSSRRPEIVSVSTKSRQIALEAGAATAPFAYVVNTTVYTRPDTTDDMNRYLRVLSNEAFLGHDDPSTEGQRRLAIGLGFNRPFSPDYRRNKLPGKCVDTVGESAPFNVGKVGFLWRVPWKLDGVQLQSDEDYGRFQSWFKTLRKKAPAAARAFLKKHRAPVPYTLIRDTLKNHNATKGLTQTLKAANPADTTVYLQLLDDDTESLRDMEGNGLFFNSDQRLSVLLKDGKPLPDVDASCYRVSTAEVPHLALSVAVEQVVRVATASEFPFGVYFPEPTSKIRIPDGFDTVPEDFREAGEKDGKQEMPKMMKAILRRRKDAAQGELEYLKEKFGFASASLVTTAPKRMLDMFYKGSQNFGSLSATGKLLRWSKDIITKIQSGTSQSHTNNRAWAKNIINAFDLQRTATLNRSEQRDILISALSKLFSSYDPMSLAKQSNQPNFTAKLHDSVSHYDAFLAKPLPKTPPKTNYKDRVRQAFITRINAVKGSESRTSILAIIRSIIGADQTTAVHKAAQAAGKAIKDVLAARLCFDEAALIKKLMSDSITDLNSGHAPSDAELTALPNVHKWAFSGDLNKLQPLVASRAAEKSRSVQNGILPIHAGICYMTEHGYKAGLIRTLGTKDNLVQKIGATTQSAIRLLLERMPEPYQAMKEAVKLLDVSPAIKQGLCCIARLSTLKERQNPLLAALRHQVFNTELLDFMLDSLSCDPNKGACLRKSTYTLPIHEAIAANSQAAVVALQKHHAKFNGLEALAPANPDRPWDKVYVETPLIQCEAIGNKKTFHAMAELVLRCGADPNEVGPDEFAPLARASERGERQYSLLLLKHGADPNQQDYNAISTLAHAYNTGDTLLAHALLDAGVDLSDSDGMNDAYLRRIYCQSLNWQDGTAEKLREAGLNLNGELDECTFIVTHEVQDEEDSENPWASDEGTHTESYTEKEENVNLLEAIYRYGGNIFDLKEHVDEHGCEITVSLCLHACSRFDRGLARFICENAPELVQDLKGHDFDPDSMGNQLESLAYPKAASGSDSERSSSASSSEESDSSSDSDDDEYDDDSDMY